MRSRFHRILALCAAVAVVGVALATPTPASAIGTTVVLNGHGFGHGRGLSQYGSLGYALAGTSYTDILNRYYSNTQMGAIPNGTLDVRLTGNDNLDLFVTASAPFVVSGNITVSGAAWFKRVGANRFDILSAANCGGGGGWAVRAANVAGPVSASEINANAGNDAGQMLQRCSTSDTRWYRGALKLVEEAGVLRTYNVVRIEDYLRGVVPRESPASWADLGGGAGLQALKAQSVAARSYAWSSPGGKTCDTTACQVYGGAFLNGVRIEDDRSNRAVAETGGQVRLLNGAVARTEFSSSSGGWTAGGTFPAIIDDGDATGLNPNRNWSVSIPAATVQAAYPSIGTLTAISVNGRNGLGDMGGRVLGMTISGSSGSVVSTGDEFRVKLGLKSNWFTVSDSPSGGVDGYWLAGSDGGIYSFGNAPFLGSAGGLPLNRPIVGAARRTDNNGYWMVASDGGIFTYGAARFFGSTGSLRLNQPVVGMAARGDNAGYWLVARDGGIFTFGSSPFFGSTGSLRLNQPVVGMAATPSGNGYWLVASDGGIFTFGDAAFRGSTGSIRLAAPIAAMAATPSGKGYWMVATDGGVFTFGDAGFFGSLPGAGVRGQQVTGITASKTGQGYLITTISGQVYSFGDAPNFGGVPSVVPAFRGSVFGIAPHFQ